MMDDRIDHLYALLPAYLRRLDAAEGALAKGRIAPGDPRPAEDFGPLRTLISILAREIQIVGESLDDLSDDAFIETCAPWVVPYIADLLGVQMLQDVPGGPDQRTRVADMLGLRSRKGTLSALEQAAADASGLAVLAVEEWKRLAVTPSLRLVHPEMGGTVSLRNKALLARIGGPFDQASHLAEMRRINGRGRSRGRFNLGNIGLHAWPLMPSRLTCHRATPADPALPTFRFHPLGCDAALWDRPRDRPDGRAAGEADMPIRISRKIMAEDPGRFYVPRGAIEVRVNGTAVPLAQIRVANLADRPPPATGWNRSSLAGAVLIDPELGRLVVGTDPAAIVEVTCDFARPLAIGGGEETRAASLGSVENPTLVPETEDPVARIVAGGGTGTYVLAKSTHYRSAGGAFTVPAGQILRLLALDSVFPTLRLEAGLTITLGDNAVLELNGIRFWQSGVTVAGSATAPGTITLRDCTLVPGLALDASGQALSPASPSLQVTAQGAALQIERSILGPLHLAEDVEAMLIDSSVDAGSSTAAAITGTASPERLSLRLIRCTIHGTTATSRFAGPAAEGITGDAALPTTDTLFAGSVTTRFRQEGCLRFCRVGAGDAAPRQYRCTSVAPSFLSLRLSDPHYLMLGPLPPAPEDTGPGALQRGSETGGEIGIWSRAALTTRFDNLSRSIGDFLRFGHAAGVFADPPDTGRS